MENTKRKPKIPVKWIEFQKTIPLIITDEVLAQIKYLVHLESDVEWSGVLFYEVEGDFSKLSSLKFITKFIHPMDVQSKGFTSYDLDHADNALVAWMMDHPEFLKYKMATVHSHNTMGAFFSGTDDDELAENSEHYNYYLSLIVNNRLEMVAKVVARVKDKHKATIINSNGMPVEITDEGNEYISLISIPCDIKFETPVVPDDYKLLTKKMFNAAKKKHEEEKKQRAIDNNVKSPLLLNHVNPNLSRHWKQNQELFVDEEFSFLPDAEDEDLEPDCNETWAVYFLTNGEPGELNTVEDVLDLFDDQWNPTYINELIANSVELYSNFVNRDYEYDTPIEEAVDVLIQVYEEYPDSKLLTTLCIALQRLKIEITNDEN